MGPFLQHDFNQMSCVMGENAVKINMRRRAYKPKNTCGLYSVRDIV